ncbi:MAG: 5-formyltetrahydrofolate cyclo-ligase [Gammaproteobacteria bacterium]|nr:5-formyltetrahydrofolate cyclo-ligase [Gammaproteobacteria bacterium]
MSREQRSEIRQQIRSARRAVDDRERTATANLIRDTLTQQDHYRTAQHVAVYDCNDGEVSVWPIIHNAWKDGKTVYLPVVCPGTTLGFVAISEQSVLRKNRYGIREPVYQEGDFFPAEKLDLILVPTVAFDRQLHRLGMGAGYYDRALSFTRQLESKSSLLLGIAFELQRISTVFPERWDIPLDRVITEKRIYSKG